MIKSRLLDGHDLILLVYPKDGKGSLSERAEQLECLFKKAGLLK